MNKHIVIALLALAIAIMVVLIRDNANRRNQVIYETLNSLDNEL